MWMNKASERCALGGNPSFHQVKCVPESHRFRVRERLVLDPPGRDGPITKVKELERQLWAKRAGGS